MFACNETPSFLVRICSHLSQPSPLAANVLYGRPFKYVLICKSQVKIADVTGIGAGEAGHIHRLAECHGGLHRQDVARHLGCLLLVAVGRHRDGVGHHDDDHLCQGMHHGDGLRLHGDAAHDLDDHGHRLVDAGHGTQSRLV